MKRLRRALLPVFTFAKIDIRRLFRDKVALFFTFAFPLIFLLVFGSLNSGGNDISFSVGLINQSDAEFSRTFEQQIRNDKTFEVNQEISSVEEARQKMSRSEVDATIILPPDFGKTTPGNSFPSGEAQILYDQNNEQAGRTLAAVLDNVFKNINNQFVTNQTPFTVTTQSTASQGLSAFDYTFAGLLGFSILSLGIFGPTNVFPRLKSRGVLRRYHTTTLKVWQYFLGNVLSTAFIGILSVTTMFVVARTLFDLDMRGDYLSLGLFVILSTVVLFGIGLAIGGWAKNENQAAPLAQIVSFPMLFLSGAFFPRFAMPEWLQGVSAVLPLTPVIDGVRMIITEGKTLLEIGPQVGLLALWALAIYVIAFRVFKWE